MDKLTVGIFLESYLHNTAGGGFSYYEALVEAIDGYVFHEALDIKFIVAGPSDDSVVKNKILRIFPYEHISKKTRYRQHFNYSLIKPATRWLKPAEKFYKYLQEKFEKAYQKAVETELVRHKIDLIYYLYPQAQRYNYPFVSTNWDMGVSSMFCFPEVGMNNAFTERNLYVQNTLKKAFAIYCESESGKAELVRYTNINENRIFVVPLFPGKVAGLQVPVDIQASYLNKYGLSKKSYFFYPAQFWPHKNHYNFLVAFKKLIQDHPSIKLLFTGSDKGNREYIGAVVTAFHLQHHVVIPGFVSSDEIHSFYRGALALVMPTFLGPTNIPLLEAEAIGCPVICSNLSGHREMMGDNACYIQPDDTESIFKALLRHVKPVQKEARANPVFSIQNALLQIEANFLKLKPVRKTFGFNFNQA